MFVISQSQSYKWPVVVQFPIDGGKFDKQTFDAEFKRIPQSRIREIGEKIESGDIKDVDLCKEVLTGWKGITDDKGDEMPFSDSARDRLLDIQLVASAVVTAFMNSLNGAKAKN